ncbi:MAG: nucleoside triphosphate pyrophosphohydrolase [bacterium]|nr:nucleoside triphosphate pyrophosphohydrolase [bacterium]
MRYHKLVRDKIPEIISRSGTTAIVHGANSEEYREKLREKLQEEVAEFLASGDPEELADILEVLFALAEHGGVSRESLEQIRARKAEERGAFRERIILEETHEQEKQCP